MTSQKTFPVRIDHVGYLISVNPLSRTSVNPINICGDKAMFQRPAYFQGTVFRDKMTVKWTLLTKLGMMRMSGGHISKANASTVPMVSHCTDKSG